MRYVHGNEGAEEAAMSGALFSLCVLKFIVNENDRPSLVLLGQHTAHVFIESCTTSELVLFLGDVENTLQMSLLKKNAHCNTTAYLHHVITILRITYRAGHGHGHAAYARNPQGCMCTVPAMATATRPMHEILRG